MPRTLSMISAVALLFAAATPALAQEREEEVVRFADLDLNSRSGADALIQRIENASERVCGFRTGAQPLTQHQYTRECTQETMEYAVRDVGHPMVLAQYYGVHPRVIIEEGDADPYVGTYYDDGYVTVKKPIKD